MKKLILAILSVILVLMLMFVYQLSNNDENKKNDLLTISEEFEK